MSFVTKREKIFEPDLLVELPARSEGKIKNYSSCTDTRAWSHHTADQTEHLMENIKRNTCICRPKYLSTEVIVKTLMTSKNKEIAKMKRKIAQLEEMLAAYDCLDLSCAQKCEIAKAHESIKACYQDLNDMSLELDLSGFTEGVDSETFETGKSGGDTTDRSCCTRSVDSRKQKSDVRFTNMGDSSVSSCKCDKATSAVDKSCTELEQIIKQKDAKLKSLQNTIKNMENDSCEPYCVYAHIYTALEKIFCVLSQNDKYREYLCLLAKGQREGPNIKAKIYFKLKILEKFSAGLISPCSPQYQKKCSCYHLQITSHIGTSYAVDSPENKRAILVADIMETEEIKAILDTEHEIGDENIDIEDDSLMNEEDDIDKKNLNRLICLQRNYDELIICYENVKYERDLIQSKYLKYDELEYELQILHDQLREFDGIKLEKDEYKTKLDELNAQYISMSEEALNCKMQLKAETEINLIKTNKIAELRDENIALETKINDAEMKYGKEKNSFQCKVMEMECKIMCQEQQIKSLREQIDRLVKENDERPTHDTPDPVESLKEIRVLKNQLTNLKEILYSSEEHKKCIENELNKHLAVTDELQREIENWKESYETVFKRHDNLEKDTEKLRNEIDRLLTINKNLINENTEKSEASENLLNVIKNKSSEINRLIDEIENQSNQIKQLQNQLNKGNINSNAEISENCEDTNSINSTIAVEIDECKDEIIYDPEQVIQYLSTKTDGMHIKKMCEKLTNKLETLQKFSNNQEIENKTLLQELKRLQEVNESTLNHMKKDKKIYSNKLELAHKEINELKRKLSESQTLSSKMQQLQSSYDQLLNEKNEHEIETKTENKKLLAELNKFKCLKDSVTYLCQKLINGEMIVQTGVKYQCQEVGNLMQHIEILQIKSQSLCDKFSVTKTELNHLKTKLEVLMAEKNELQNEVEDKINVINKLHQSLEKEVKKNKSLCDEIHKLKVILNGKTKGDLVSSNEQCPTLNKVESKIMESMVEPDKSDALEKIKKELLEAKKAYTEMESQKDKFLKRFEEQMYELKQIRIENQSLYNQKKTLINQNINLENDMEELRNKIMAKACAPQFDCNVIIKEIRQMKNEKLQTNEKNHELSEKIDKMNDTISNLTEQLVTRTDKIAILENYINALEDEVRKWQQSLGLAVSTGEQLCYNSVKNRENTLKSMDSNRSKIVQDLKRQIKKLQDENTTVEKQWFAIKLQFDEIQREKSFHNSEIIHLKNERDIILVEIRQLETKLIGDSTLRPQNTSFEEIMTSIRRVMKHVEATDAKNATLEHTLMKVQTSSQLLLSKADEAKMIIEKEKLKMHSEKEEAIRDKLLLTKELSSLKEKLGNQISVDKQIIKDLEAELLNHKLIIQNISESNGNDIVKFEKEMKYLRNMYKQSVLETKELRETLQTMVLEKEVSQDVLKNNNKILNEKLDEITCLKQQLSELCSNLVQKLAKETQTETKVLYVNVTTQTVTVSVYDFSSDMSDITKNNENCILNTHDNECNTESSEDVGIMNLAQMTNKIIVPSGEKLELDESLRYRLNEKLKSLGKGTLEQFSINTFPPACYNLDNIKSNEKLAPCKYYSACKDYPEPFLHHRIPEEFHKRGSIVEVDSIKTENCSKTKISIKSEQKPLNELFHLTHMEKNAVVSTENQSLLPNKTQISTTMICGDKITNSNRKYLNESYKQDCSPERYSIEKNMAEHYKRWDFSDFRNDNTQVPTPNNNLISRQDNVEIKEHILKRNVSCTATANINIKLDSSSNGDLSINATCDTKRTPINSYLYSVYSTNNLIVYSEENFAISESQSSLINEEFSSRSKIVTTFFDHRVHSSQPNLASHHENEGLLNNNSKFVTTKNQAVKKYLMSNNHTPKNQTYINEFEIHKNIENKTHIVNAFEQELYIQTPTKKNNDCVQKNHNNFVSTIKDDSSRLKIKNKMKGNVEQIQNNIKYKSIEVGIYNNNEASKGEKELNIEPEYIRLNSDSAQVEDYDDCNNIVDGSTKRLLTPIQNENNILYTNEAVVRPKHLKETPKNQAQQITIEKVPTKIDKTKSNPSTKTLVATKVVAVEIKPKPHIHDECACMFGLNASTVATKHEGDNRERLYTTHVTRKILNKDIEELNVDELKFLHSKVCQSWRSKMQSEKELVKRLKVLEAMKDPKQNEDMQRKIREERRKLLEFQKAVFCATTDDTRTRNPEPKDVFAETRIFDSNTLRTHVGDLRTLFSNAEKDIGHPVNKGCHLIDDTATGTRAKPNACRTGPGRQTHEDKREIRVRRGAGVGRQRKK